MPAKKPLKTRSKEDVISAIGVFISLFALLVMFSGNTHLWGLAYGIDFILGFAGFWFFCPFLFFVGFHMTWKRKLPKIPTKRLAWAYFFLFLGSMFLLSHLGSNGKESYGDTTLFLDEIAAAKEGKNGGLIFDTKLGGGMIGYILTGLLNQSVGAWLVILSLAIFLAVGLIILFFPQIKLLFRTIKAKIAIAKAKKRSKTQAPSDEETNSNADEGLSFGTMNNPESLPAPSKEPAPAPKAEPAPEIVLTRRSLYASQPVAPSHPIPHEVTKAPSPVGNLQTSGLQPALFSGDEVNDVVPETPAPVQEAPAEEPTAPAPTPEQNLFAPANPFEDKPEVVEAPLTPDESEIETPAAPVEPLPEDVAPTPIVPEPAPVVKPVRVAKPTPAPVPTPEPEPEPEAPTEEPEEAAGASNGVSQPKAVPLPSYRFPPLTLLKVYPPDESAAQNEADTAERTEVINTTFANLHVGARVVSHTIGPSVTRYDVQTDPSVSVTTIGKYVQDISVRLGGVSTRFEEMVRGKSTSGLEIANHATTIVSFKEMISALPKGDKNNLVIPFGKSISGDYVYADLSDFPHMLVAGTTGSGKSIFMHGVIMSLIMRNRPEDLRIVVVDPKRVEMAKYKDLPHLLCPIVSDGGAAKVCLDKLIEEMERRYLLFEMAGVSNIRQFNKEYAPAAGVQTLPFIVVFVDEYADLSDQCKDIAGSVVRIAQKARAAGIHLVIATQRPSVQVITGVIKANLGVRVALSVASPTDSVTILNQGGAEQLAGHGDMLIECPLISRVGLTRVQGCLVDNQEIKDVCTYIKKEHATVYDPRFLDLVDHSKDVAPAADVSAPSAAEIRNASAEEKYNYIKETIMGREYTSISQIQREFGVGFPRAGKIFAQLQKEGIVATQTESASSSKGCRVLVHSDPNAQQNPGSTEQTDVRPNLPGDGQ
jgi:DNA segregation ATPase FtsK/SpoIIIE-like protein